MTRLLLQGWAVSAVLMALLWLRQLRTRNATSVDVAWSALMGALGAAYGVFSGGDPGRRLLVGGLALIWAGRLAWHLFTDRVVGQPEDARYRTMRERWGPHAATFFFLYYQVQALVATLFSVPLLAAMRGGPLDGWAVAGAAVWLLAVSGETIADRQLAAFRADPANRSKTYRAGLWRTSRHPNYFFEWLHWFTYSLIAHGAWLTWLGPGLMLLFLFRLSGIPLAEEQALRSRGEEYRAYQRETSIFIPWFPKGG